MQKLIVIGGISRSGTNLARRIIGSHSKIAIPPGEFQLFSQWANGRDVKKILSNKRLKKWGIDFSDLSGLDHKDVFIRALTRYTRAAGKEIPGEKTPFNEFYYPMIKACLKNERLKFIHLVRNPFDVMASYKHFNSFKIRGQYKFNPIKAHIANWRRSVSMGLARSYRYPVEYFLITYEELAADPEAKTRELCEFIGVDFEKERMLSLADYNGHKDNSSFQQGPNQAKPQPDKIQKPESRKHYLNPSEIRLVSQTCGELALALGYEEEGFRSLAPEHLRPNIIKKLKGIARSYISNSLP